MESDPLPRELAFLAKTADGVFECSIRGDSMSPAIPAGARLRVRVTDGRACKVGDVVLFRTETGFMAHRVVHVPGRLYSVGFVLTLGDNCLVGDVPLAVDRILGTVVYIRTGTGWRPPGGVVIPTLLHGMIRAATGAAVKAAMFVKVGGARRVVAFLMALHRIGRAPAARLLVLPRRQFYERARLALAMRPFARLLGRVLRPGVKYLDIDAVSFNAKFPSAHREAVANHVSLSHTGKDGVAVRAHQTKEHTRLNPRYRDLPPGIPALDDLYPPNVAVLDFLARLVDRPDDEVLLDYPCGIGVLLVYARALGYSQIYGFDNWYALARSTAEQFLGRNNIAKTVLLSPDELDSVPVTIVSCIGFPLSLLAAGSSVLAKTSIKYVLADSFGAPTSLPGYTRIREYSDLVTVFQKSDRLDTP